jgi:hypothetical protein
VKVSLHMAFTRQQFYLTKNFFLAWQEVLYCKL